MATSILIPKVVDLCRGRVSPLSGKPVYVVAAGGIFDGRGLAMALALGAQAVWVGTRFVCAKEAGAPASHQQAILGADYHDTIRTTIFTGRPMRVLKNEYISEWEEAKLIQNKALIAKGVIPISTDFNEERPLPASLHPFLMGQCAAAVTSIEPAAKIIHDMMSTAVAVITHSHALIKPAARL